MKQINKDKTYVEWKERSREAKHWKNMANNGKTQSGNEERRQEDWVETNRHNVTEGRGMKDRKNKRQTNRSARTFFSL